jgi:hypothetical protein
MMQAGWRVAPERRKKRVAKEMETTEVTEWGWGESVPEINTKEATYDSSSLFDRTIVFVS